MLAGFLEPVRPGNRAIDDSAGAGAVKPAAQRAAHPLVDTVRGLDGQLGFVSRLVDSAFGQVCLGPSEPGRYYVLRLAGRCRVGDGAVEGTPDVGLAAARMDRAD